MKTPRLSKFVSGVCVIAASVSVGCTTLPEARYPHASLDTFVVDCRIKQQQIEFINAQRTSKNEQLAARVAVAVAKWQVFTDFDGYVAQHRVGEGQHSWMIDQILWELKQCPD